MTDDKPKSVCLYSNNLAYNSYKDVRSNLNLGVFERPDTGILTVSYTVKRTMPDGSQTSDYFECDLALLEKVTTDVREVWEAALYNRGISAQSRMSKSMGAGSKE
ncbi:hypothetical protein [Candidatus Methanomassiliicoccus intestinalis]|uniref:hypothetical protein n=1 Tax=Candidatus Methanomassiliicoccus intestinalis TaxID=1406512 RepID=UPI0037DDE14B